MGAQWFTTYRDGRDIRQAFAAAVADARWEDGHGGYTGTIAEKDFYVTLTETPLSPEGADALAETLADRDDKRIADTWGPAGAIPVKQPTSPADQSEPDGWLFCGYASS